MSVTKGLAGFRKIKEENERRAAERDRPKAEWFDWKKNAKAPSPNEVLVQFLQELDPDSAGYNEDRGLAVAAVEHEAPGAKGYQRRALCTLESEGQCYVCERRKANYEEGWRTKTNFYINALIDYNGKGEPEVAVLSRNFNNPFTQQLLGIAVDDGTITDTVFKVTRVGSGKQTVWTLMPTKAKKFSEDNVEAFDLEETVLRSVPYDNQAKYYGQVWDGAESSDSDETGPDSDTVEW